MPYVSPRGLVKSNAPEAPLQTALPSSVTSISTRSRRGGASFTPSTLPRKELGELIEGRDADPEMVALMASLESWSGWTQVATRKIEPDLDPLDPGTTDRQGRAFDTQPQQSRSFDRPPFMTGVRRSNTGSQRPAYARSTTSTSTSYSNASTMGSISDCEGP